MSELRVLIVEDELLIAEDLRLNLLKMGHKVVGIVAEGSKAIQSAMALHPDLVLMDVRLQGAMNGIQTAREIRSREDIPIVYITAHASVLGSSELEDRCTRLSKPFSPKQLESAIQRICGVDAA